MDAAEIERRVVARLRDVADHSPHEVSREHDLRQDFGLSGRSMCRAGELIEEEFGITLSPSELLDIALYEPTVGGLCDLVEEALADA